jgi:hypothetical protein
MKDILFVYTASPLSLSTDLTDYRAYEAILEIHTVTLEKSRVRLQIKAVWGGPIKGTMVTLMSDVLVFSGDGILLTV